MRKGFRPERNPFRIILQILSREKKSGNGLFRSVSFRPLTDPAGTTSNQLRHDPFWFPGIPASSR
jgi:hypothetical protein